MEKIKKYFGEVFLRTEACDGFFIPEQYIKKVEIEKNKVTKIIIDKKYLEVVEKYHENISPTHKSKDIFMGSLDIVSIEYKDKEYWTNFIEKENVLGGYNALQKIESNDDEIIFEWDIDERNIAEYDDIGAIEKLIINEKYKKYFLNLRIEIKKGITYWK